jgi:hypothetical protein
MSKVDGNVYVYEQGAKDDRVVSNLSGEKIIEIAKGVAAQHLAGLWAGRVDWAPSVDALDRDALEVTFFLTPGSSAKVTGDMAINTTFELNQKLQAAGEERFSITRYSSE